MTRRGQDQADPEAGLFEELRALHERRATGALEIDADGQKRKLYLRDGDLYLPGAHPLAQQLRGLIAALSRTRAPDSDARRHLVQLVEKIAVVLSNWSRKPRNFEAGVRYLPADLAGPLPTVNLLMAGRLLGLGDPGVEGKARSLVGRWMASPDADRRADALGYSPEQMFVLERLRVPMSVEELEQQSPVPIPDLHRALLGLLTIGAVRGEQEAPVSSPLVDSELIGRLSSRISRSLVDRPLELSAEEYMEKIADLLARHGGLDHYELLGVGPSATAESVQSEFESLARLVHPSNAARFGWGGRERALQMLFERAVRAYEALIDPLRRQEYNRRQGIVAPGSSPSGEAREREAEAVARDQFERALAYAAAGDNHSAVQLLEQVARTDERVEYWSALARVQAKNPGWLQRSLESYRRALQLDPENPEVRFAMGDVFERMGELDRARAQFAAALRANPDHFEAVERIRRIEQRRKEESPRRRGLLSRLFGRE
ncbi:MAG TPA: tetratricopeptide repeat protein [Thermoanaerobaculia bacterium]|nr:tetratricopeptide repeat protein [Thermoanaerobaculia bacterium]